MKINHSDGPRKGNWYLSRSVIFRWGLNTPTTSSKTLRLLYALIADTKNVFPAKVQDVPKTDVVQSSVSL